MGYEEKSCKRCGKVFIPKSGRNWFCSSNCCIKEGKERLAKNKEMNAEKYIKQQEKYDQTRLQKKIDRGDIILKNLIFVCKICKKPFPPNHGLQRLCGSDKCKRENWRIGANLRRKKLGEIYKEKRKEYDKKRHISIVGYEPIKKVSCIICGKEFQRKKINNKCCSEKCLKKYKGEKGLKRYYNNYEENIIKRKMKYKQRKENDKNYYITLMLRSRLRDALNCKHIRKTKSALDLIGCTIDELRMYLQQQFTDEMSWDNYGFKGWHIDHIKPCARFDLSKEEEQKKCFHYTNLQPLWWYDNFSKGASYEEI